MGRLTLPNRRLAAIRARRRKRRSMGEMRKEK
jgi:hypothetical protein